MDTLYREPTNVTPYVAFNAETGLLFIEGRSIPENAEMYYAGILNWLDKLIVDPPAVIELSVNLDFLNIASSKRLLFAMYRLNEAREKGSHVHIKWYYDMRDQDMLEVGMDYSQMVDKIPFQFVPLTTELSIFPTLKVG